MVSQLPSVVASRLRGEEVKEKEWGFRLMLGLVFRLVRRCWWELVGRSVVEMVLGWVKKDHSR